MHMRAVEHTNRRGLCTHHAAWVNRTDYRCRGCLKSPGRPPDQPLRGCRGAFRRSFCRFGTSVELLVAYIDPSQTPSMAVVSAVDPRLRPSASRVDGLRSGVRYGTVRLSTQRWVNTIAHRYRATYFGLPAAKRRS